MNNLTTGCRREFESTVREFATLYGRQSDRNMPSIKLFKIGLEKIKLTGSEKGNQLFMIWISMLPLHKKSHFIKTEQTSFAKVSQQKIYKTNNEFVVDRVHHEKLMNTSSKYNKWLSLFEKLLSITEWLSCSYDPISTIMQ